MYSNRVNQERHITQSEQPEFFPWFLTEAMQKAKRHFELYCMANKKP